MTFSPSFKRDRLFAKPLAAAAATLPEKPHVKEERIDEFIAAIENAARFID